MLWVSDMIACFTNSIPASRTISDTRKPLRFLAITPTDLVGVFVSGRFLVVGKSGFFLPAPKQIASRAQKKGAWKGFMQSPRPSTPRRTHTMLG